MRRSAEIVWYADAAQMRELAGCRAPEPWLNDPTSTNAPAVHARHPNKRANVAWVDGHVSTEPVHFFDPRAGTATLADREKWAVGDLDQDRDPATKEYFISWEN